jgi:hypothetical protein
VSTSVLFAMLISSALFTKVELTGICHNTLDGFNFEVIDRLPHDKGCKVGLEGLELGIDRNDLERGDLDLVCTVSDFGGLEVLVPGEATTVLAEAIVASLARQCV